MATVTNQPHNAMINLPFILNINNPEILNNEIDKEIVGNGYKDDLLSSFSALQKSAKKEHAEEIYEISKHSFDAVKKIDKKNLIKEFNNVFKNSMHPVTAVWRYNRITDMDLHAKHIIDVVDKPIPEANDVTVNVRLRENSKNELLSFNSLLDFFRKPFEEKEVRKRIINAVNKQLFKVLKEALDEVLNKSNIPLFVGEEVYEWRNFNKVPNHVDFEQIDSRWICVEYKTEEKDRIIDWTKRTVDFTIEHKLESPYIAVMADFNKDYKISALIGDFCKVGASFEEFPEGSENFRDALQRLELELKGI